MATPDPIDPGPQGERLTWEGLKTTSQECESIYKETIETIETKKFLPNPCLSLLQYHLQTSSRSSVLHALTRRFHRIRKRQIGIILAGQVNAGKSTFVNILMGGEYLPMDLLPTTKLVCELHHEDQDCKVILKYQEKGIANVTLPLSREPQSVNWQLVRSCITEKRHNDMDLSRIVIYWRLSLDHNETAPKRHDMDHERLVGFMNQLSGPCVRDTRAASTSTTRDAIDETEVKQLYRTDDSGISRHQDEVPGSESRRDRVASEDDSRTANTSSLGASMDPTRGMHDFMESSLDKLHDEYESLEDPANKDTGGFSLVFLDCPGTLNIKPEESRRTILKNLVTCHSFIFVIDAHNAVDQNSLMMLMEEIERNLEEQNAVLSPESALFVINKMDLIPDDRAEDITNEIVQQLKSKWHFLRPENIIRIEAKQILKGASSDSRSQKTRLLQKLQDFIRVSTLITFEEHLLWLLDMLETAWAIVCRGKNLKKSPMKKRLVKLQKENALILQQLGDINDLDIIEEIKNNIITEIKNDVDWFKNADLSCEAVKELHNDAKEGYEWNSILERIDRELCRRLCERLNCDRKKKLQDEYAAKMTKRYEPVLQYLTSVLKQMNGLLENDNKENGSIFQFLVSVVGTGLVRTPQPFHFAFLAIPLVSIYLIVRSIYEDGVEYVNENARDQFVSNPNVFLQQRASSIFGNRQVAGIKSKLFEHMFGAPVQEELTKKIEKIMEAVQFMITGSTSHTEEQKNKIHSLIENAMSVYSKRVMTKDIQRFQLKWLYMSGNDMRSLVAKTRGSTVYNALYTDREGKTVPVAVKEVRFGRGQNEYFCNDVFKECLMLRRLSRERPHPNVVTFYGCDASFEEESYVRLVFELCLGNLTAIIDIKEVLRDNNCRQRQFNHYAHECAAGLAYLHEKRIVHRDVKPSNFLLKPINAGLEPDCYRVVISDMGLAKNEERVSTNRLGTNAYLAPEVARGVRFHQMSSDVYSLGLVFWELWFRQEVFRWYEIHPSAHAPDLPKENRHKKIKLLLEGCLGWHPSSRLTAAKVMERLQS